MAPQPIELRIRLAGSLVVAGLLVQALSLLKIHPLAFVAFLLVGCPLVLAGVLLFLYSLVRPEGR
ncbi:MAG TPA: hypothetical protein VMV31_06960 [Terriglobales bacterium]|nr:hypothetical protein [Terriglobales bacterium]